MPSQHAMKTAFHHGAKHAPVAKASDGSDDPSDTSGDDRDESDGVCPNHSDSSGTGSDNSDDNSNNNLSDADSVDGSGIPIERRQPQPQQHYARAAPVKSVPDHHNNSGQRESQKHRKVDKNTRTAAGIGITAAHHHHTPNDDSDDDNNNNSITKKKSGSADIFPLPPPPKSKAPSLPPSLLLEQMHIRLAELEQNHVKRIERALQVQEASLQDIRKEAQQNMHTMTSSWSQSFVDLSQRVRAIDEKSASLMSLLQTSSQCRMNSSAPNAHGPPDNAALIASAMASLPPIATSLKTSSSPPAGTSVAAITAKPTNGINNGKAKVNADAVRASIARTAEQQQKKAATATKTPAPSHAGPQTPIVENLKKNGEGDAPASSAAAVSTSAQWNAGSVHDAVPPIQVEQQGSITPDDDSLDGWTSEEDGEKFVADDNIGNAPSGGAKTHRRATKKTVRRAVHPPHTVDLLSCAIDINHNDNHNDSASDDTEEQEQDEEPGDAAVHPNHGNASDDAGDVCAFAASLLQDRASSAVPPPAPTTTTTAHQPQQPKDGPHAALHRLIVTVGSFQSPTHNDLDEIWFALPAIEDAQYPTALDIPDVGDRQAKLLQLMISLYDHVSALACQEKVNPDNYYALSGGMQLHHSHPTPAPIPPSVSLLQQSTLFD